MNVLQIYKYNFDTNSVEQVNDTIYFVNVGNSYTENVYVIKNISKNYISNLQITLSNFRTLINKQDSYSEFYFNNLYVKYSITQSLLPPDNYTVGNIVTIPSLQPGQLVYLHLKIYSNSNLEEIYGYQEVYFDVSVVYKITPCSMNNLACLIDFNDLNNTIVDKVSLLSVANNVSHNVANGSGIGIFKNKHDSFQINLSQLQKNINGNDFTILLKGILYNQKTDIVQILQADNFKLLFNNKDRKLLFANGTLTYTIDFVFYSTGRDYCIIIGNSSIYGPSVIIDGHYINLPNIDTNIFNFTTSAITIGDNDTGLLADIDEIWVFDSYLMQNQQIALTKYFNCFIPQVEVSELTKLLN